MLEMIARGLVDRPDDVVVTETSDADTTVYEMKVASDDLGKVIGKQGRTARAMRVLVATASATVMAQCRFTSRRASNSNATSRISPNTRTGTGECIPFTVTLYLSAVDIVVTESTKEEICEFIELITERRPGRVPEPDR